MKKTLLVLFLFLAVAASAQDAKDIFKRAHAKCLSVSNGYYELTERMKSMSGKDTSLALFTCSFKKIPGDTLFPVIFHTRRTWKDTVWSDIIYTGNELLVAYWNDSVATISSKALWADHIKATRHNFTFYTPFTSRTCDPLPEDSEMADVRNTVQYFGEEMAGGMPCYHVGMKVYTKPEETTDMHVVKQELEYWINKNDDVPVQYSLTLTLVMNSDTMCQYELFTITKYELNKLKDEKELTLASVPKYYTLKDYVPSVSPKPLPIDTMAPGWSLSGLKKEKISLEGLKGKLVLVDFFYRSCYPCMKALPVLQALHEKYKSSNLVVIGIDPMDKKEEELKFLAKRGVTYTILLSDRDLPAAYRVDGYPTLYLIDGNGKILYTHLGYGDNMEKDLDEVIRQHLPGTSN